MTTMIWQPGVPTNQRYREALRSELFTEIEAFAEAFRRQHADILARSYARRWVSDPFHQWSRQWEYPFVADKLRHIVSDSPSARILDAGSGVTFFPYFLGDAHRGVEIDAIDSDTSFTAAFRALNERHDTTVDFRPGDLRGLPLQCAEYDAVYCLSVLEHTREYQTIAQEFQRVLKPGGTLIVSFDISLDGNRNVPVPQARQLVDTLDRHFRRDEEPPGDLEAALVNTDIVTTRTIGRENPELLPWRYPPLVHQLHSWIRGTGFPSWPPELTVYCGVWRHPGEHPDPS